MKQTSKLDYVSGSVTVWTERQNPTAVQVCWLMITIQKVLRYLSVTAAFKKSLAMKQVLSPSLHTTFKEIISLGSQRNFYLFNLASVPGCND